LHLVRIRSSDSGLIGGVASSGFPVSGSSVSSTSGVIGAWSLIFTSGEIGFGGSGFWYFHSYRRRPAASYARIRWTVGCQLSEDVSPAGR
jgi:hypothetical protein